MVEPEAVAAMLRLKELIAAAQSRSTRKCGACRGSAEEVLVMRELI